MITGAAKAKVDAIWQKMWEGGITNPIEVISQLTYLMFMRSLDEREFEAESMEAVLGVPQKHIFPETYRNAYGVEIPGSEMRWSRFKDKASEEMYRMLISSFSLSLKIWVAILLFLKRWKVQRLGFLQERPLCLKKRLMA